MKFITKTTLKAYQYAWRGPSDVSHAGVYCPGRHFSGQRRQGSQPSSIFSSVVRPLSMVHENVYSTPDSSHRWTPQMWWTRDVHRRTHSWLEGNRYRTTVYVSETELTQHVPSCFCSDFGKNMTKWKFSVSSFLPLYHHDWSYRPNRGLLITDWLDPWQYVLIALLVCNDKNFFFETYIINKTL